MIGRKLVRSSRVRIAGLLGLALAVAALALLPGSAATAKRNGTRAAIQLDGGSGDLVRHLTLERGKTTFLETAYDVKRVSVGEPRVADVVVLGANEIQLVAKDLGDTNVVLWDEAGNARSAIDVAVLRPHASIEKEMRRVTGNEEIRIESAGESIVLKGSVPDTGSADQALRLAKAFFPNKGDKNKIINLLEVGGNQQVMIEVAIAEMSRSLTREMESNFSAMISSGSQEIQIFNFLENLVSFDATENLFLLNDRVNLAGGFQNFGSGDYNLFLNFLQGKGLVKILAEPTLVARSGQTASFLAGGEVAIPVAQGGAFGSVTVEFKEFGVLVAFTPTVMARDRIHMEISPEVSEPDFTLGTTVDGTTVPGFRTRRAATGVELGDGQSFAIAGLLSESVRESASQYPVLGDIPILGTLFRSKRYLKNETELALIVRPRLVKPMKPGEIRLPTEDYIEPSDYEFYLTSAMEGSASEEEAEGQAGAEPGLLGEAGHRISIQEAEKELK